MKRLENLYVNVTPKDLLKASEPIAEQRISGSAPIVAEYEKAAAQAFGRKHAVALCSGTVSIYAAMRALGIGPGDEVILPATAVVMSGLPALLLGAKVVFADNISPDNFGLDANAVRAVVNNKTKAILSVPLWGYPVPMDDLLNLSKETGVTLLEDIAQAHGTTWNGKRLGAFGFAGCASTHERKLITTGEGGLVLTDDDVFASKVATIVRYGLDSNGAGYSLGYNFKLSAPAAALGMTQVGKLEEKIKLRSKVAGMIKAGLSDVSWLKEISVPTGSMQNFYALVMQILDPAIPVKKLDKHLADRGVISDTWRYGFRPLYEYPLFTSPGSHCQNAVDLISSVFTLPCHEGLNEEDLAQIISAIKSF